MLRTPFHELRLPCCRYSGRLVCTAREDRLEVRQGQAPTAGGPRVGPDVTHAQMERQGEVDSADEATDVPRQPALPFPPQDRHNDCYRQSLDATPLTEEFDSNEVAPAFSR